MRKGELCKYWTLPRGGGGRAKCTGLCKVPSGRYAVRSGLLSFHRMLK